MTAISHKLSLRIGDLLRKGRFSNEEELLTHALNLVESEDSELAEAYTSLSALLDDRAETPSSEGVSVDLTSIKSQYVTST